MIPVLTIDGNEYEILNSLFETTNLANTQELTMMLEILVSPVDGNLLYDMIFDIEFDEKYNIKYISDKFAFEGYGIVKSIKTISISPPEQPGSLKVAIKIKATSQIEVIEPAGIELDGLESNSIAERRKRNFDKFITDQRERSKQTKLADDYNDRYDFFKMKKMREVFKKQKAAARSRGLKSTTSPSSASATSSTTKPVAEREKKVGDNKRAIDL